MASRSVLFMSSVFQRAKALFVFKVYYASATCVFSWVNAKSAAAVGLGPYSTRETFARAAVWALIVYLTVTIGVEATRGCDPRTETRAPLLGWSKGATIGTLFFVVVFYCLSRPLLNSAAPLSVILVALTGIVAAMGGTVLYLSIYMDAPLPGGARAVEALKVEHQLWILVFTGSIVWAGVFIGGAVLGTSLARAGEVLQRQYPSVPEPTIQRIILYHAIAVGYVGVGIILWMLRPAQRRLSQISRQLATTNY